MKAIGFLKGGTRACTSKGWSAGLGLLLGKLSLLVLLLAFAQAGSSQINAYETFDPIATPAGWTYTGFFRSTTTPCEGTASLRRNFWSSSPTGNVQTTTWTSSGLDLDISFDYKITNFTGGGATPNAPAWGELFVELSTDGGATYPIAVGSINPSNHTPSTACANAFYTVPGASLPEGNTLRVRLRGQWSAGDYYFYLDNVVLQQDGACGNFTHPGNPCDDGDTSTLGDVLDANCDCIGMPIMNPTPCGLNLAIPDIGCASNNYLELEVPVAGEPNALGTNVALQSVDIITTHTFNGDLRIFLVSPNGVQRELVNRRGSGGDNFGNPANCPNAVLTLQDGAAAPTGITGNNVTGTFAPEQSLAGFSDGSDPNGDWTIRICDAASGDVGALQYVALNFAPIACLDPAATVSTIDDCTNGQFMLNVNLTSLGSASSVTIATSVGDTLFNAMATGNYQFGAYAFGTPVGVTLIHNDNATCNVGVGTFTSTGPACPLTNPSACGLNLAVPDNGCVSNNYMEVEIAVAGQPNALGTNVTLQSVDLITTHTFNGDLRIFLVSPNGVQRELVNRRGSFGDNFGNPANCPNAVLTLQDGAANPTGITGNNVTGTFAPEQSLAGFNDGSDPNGNWTIRICDAVSGDVGALQHVALNFAPILCLEPAATASTADDCDNGQYTLSVNLTSLGSASSVTIATSVGDTLFNAMATGSYQFGAYAFGTPVGVTLIHNDNAACSVGVGTFTSMGLSCPPANDFCSDATSIACGQTLSGTTVGAAFDDVGTCVTSNTSPGVWYAFTGTGTPATVSTCGQASFDTKLSVFTGACGALVCVSGNDDSAGCSGFTSQLTFPTTAGTTYYVLVHGFGANTGTFNLTLTCAPVVLGCTDPTATNYDPNANTDDGSCVFPPATCAEAQTVGLGIHSTGPINSGNGASNVCTFSISGNALHARWYAFTPAESGEYIISSAAFTVADTRLSIHTGSCGDLTCYASNDDVGGGSFASQVTECFEAGITYYIEWDNRWSSSGFSWSIVFTGVGACAPCDLDIASVSTESGECPDLDEGVITVTAMSSNGPITYSISGPVAQSNSTGVFEGLPAGNYTVRVEDAANCEAETSVALAAGVDNEPPTAVCRTTTVVLSPAGTYELQEEDVFDAMLSSDNCGIASVAFPATLYSCNDEGMVFMVPVQVFDPSNNAGTCNAIITVEQGTELPMPWSTSSLGSGTGDAIYEPCVNNGEFTLTSNARLFPMNTDNYQYVHQELCGNITITAKITQFAPNGWQGLYIRNVGGNNAAGLAYRVQGNTTTMPSSLAQAHIRQTDGGTLELSQFNTFVQPYWVRLVSTPLWYGGRLVQLYASPNGTNWTLAQSRIVSGLKNCVDVGLILQSQDFNTTVEAKFAHVSATGTLPMPLQGPNSPTVQQQPAARTAELFPNPASSHVTLSFSQPLDADAPYILRNQMGQAVLRGTLNTGDFSTELNVANLAAGMYSIEVLANGSEREVLRFIKQ